MFIESRFDSNQLLTICKTAFILITRVSGLRSVAIMLVSSANSIGTDGFFTTEGRSLIYIRNNKGPRIEP
jgi:hypothetical protein